MLNQFYIGSSFVNRIELCVVYYFPLLSDGQFRLPIVCSYRLCNSVSILSLREEAKYLFAVPFAFSVKLTSDTE